MMTPATVVHELGHSTICVASGYKSDIKIDLLSATTYCYTDSVNYLYYSFGGVLAFLVFMAPMTLAKVRSTTWLFIPLVVLAISHGINAGMETLAYDYYIKDNSVLPSLLLVVSLMLYFGLLIKYGRVEQKHTLVKTATLYQQKQLPLNSRLKALTDCEIKND